MDYKSTNKVQIFENIKIYLIKLLCAAELAIYSLVLIVTSKRV